MNKTNKILAVAGVALLAIDVVIRAVTLINDCIDDLKEPEIPCFYDDDDDDLLEDEEWDIK